MPSNKTQTGQLLAVAAVAALLHWGAAQLEAGLLATGLHAAITALAIFMALLVCTSRQDDGWNAELWVVKELKLISKDTPNALYPGISNGEFVGVISLPKGLSDFRGQAIPAGIYTLRYQYIPQDANHMGVSPNPDFLLAIPAASDATPGDPLPYKKLVSLSSKVTGAHPAVIAMETAGEQGQAVFKEKLLIFTAPVKSSGTEPLQKIGIVLKGQAAQ